MLRSFVNAYCVTQFAIIGAMDTPGKRLQWARRHHGKFDKPTEAALALGWTVSTYLGHENGDRNPSRAAAKKYARAYGVRWEWLLDADGAPIAKGTLKASVAGYVGAGAEVISFPEDSALGDEAPLPPGASPDTIAVIVRGDSMYPRYFDGEFLYYMPEPRAPEELLGRECVIKLLDGRMFVKILRRGSKKPLFHLESWNGPLLEDQALEWACPVIWRG